VSATRTRTPDYSPGFLPSDDPPLGVAPLDTHLGLQTDSAKELCNKIAWVLGSTYRVPYANMKTDARRYAWRIVKKILEDNGYPSKIAK